MEERIKEIRKHYKLTQGEFAEKIGIKQNTVTSYETGLRTPSDIVITSICREFDVNEHWLRTGEGNMIAEKTRDEELSEFFGDVIKGEPSFQYRLVSALSRLSSEDWENLENIAYKLLEDIKKTGSAE